MVSSIHEFCHFLPSLGWNMETAKKCMQESRRDVLWCDDAGQNVGCKANANVSVSVAMSMSECCAHTVAMSVLAWH